MSKKVTKNDIAAYRAAVRRVVAFSAGTVWKHSSPAALKASIKRLQQMLDRLGNPERKIKFIHVTGTSGKGSVTALIHDILLADHRTVASYTSPHTTTFVERFRINKQLIHPGDLAKNIDDVLLHHRKHIKAGGEALTYFELATCIAFVAFAEAKVEWCVLEVGLGGRWDSTNIIPKKEVAVITNIDFDHTDILGKTKEKIAREKAGIITKATRTAISGVREPRVRSIIEAAARSAKVPLLIVPSPNDNHLLHNALLASAAARSVDVSPAIIERAIAKHHRLPCRFETIQRNPLVILDGAHNVAKMQATVREVRAMLGKKKLNVIFGCKEDKDAGKILNLLSPIATSITSTQYKEGRGSPISPIKLLSMVPRAKRELAFTNSREALEHVLKTAKNNDAILITGSLYLAGEMRTGWVSEENILRHQSSDVA